MTHSTHFFLCTVSMSVFTPGSHRSCMMWGSLCQTGSIIMWNHSFIFSSIEAAATSCWNEPAGCKSPDRLPGGPLCGDNWQPGEREVRRESVQLSVLLFRGYVTVAMRPALDSSPGYLRYWDFGQFGNSPGLYNTLVQTPAYQSVSS